MRTQQICCRRIDEFAGLELFRLTIGERRIFAESNLICMEVGGYHLSHVWELTVGLAGANASNRTA